MGLEIRELHIKVNIDEKPGNQGTPDSGKENDKDALLSACLDEVLQVINKKKER